ncbi:prepilin peptidase [Iamia majanohamensis]|uniref:Prepilin peptidase n=1 Tax=Iamia majanohamensis TaxID=467976 RepID=A0AAE9Y6G1_9ACTN|nr:A24 family peptidase [Iamia majanohamensis]WCO65173.1 prepilin peptidase [Iamia majanohamensis]
MAGTSPLLLVLLGLGGLVVGSFLNVVIVRLPDGGSLLRPPSHCPQCEAPIRPADNIPILSYVLLRGRCRSCREPIPLGYPLVEAGNAVLWVAAGARFGATWALIPFLLLFSTLLAQSVIDLELYRLLDKITFPVLGASAVLVAAVSLVEGEPDRILYALGGAVGYFVFLFVPALIYPRGMGLGDVKLALLMGLFLGWINPLLCLYALIAACLLGLVAGVVLFLARGRKSAEFPFGPWLALGCVLVILFSGTILDVYDASAPAFLALLPAGGP